MYKLFFCRTLAHPPRTLGTAVSSPTPLTSCSSPWSVRSLIISAVWGWWSLIVINTDNKDCSLNSNKNIELMAAFETMMLGMKIGLPVLNLGIDTSTITACYASRPLHQAEHMIRKTIFFLLQFFFFRSKQQWSCLVWNRLGLLGLAGHFERVPGKRKKTMFLMILKPEEMLTPAPKNVWATCQGRSHTKSTGKRGQQWNAGALALKRSWCPNYSIQ